TAVVSDRLGRLVVFLRKKRELFVCDDEIEVAIWVIANQSLIQPSRSCALHGASVLAKGDRFDSEVLRPVVRPRPIQPLFELVFPLRRPVVRSKPMFRHMERLNPVCASVPE